MVDFVLVNDGESDCCPLVWVIVVACVCVDGKGLIGRFWAISRYLVIYREMMAHGSGFGQL